MRGSRAHQKRPSQTLPRTPKLWEPLESPAAQPVSPGWGFVVPCLLPDLSTKHVPALAALQPPGRLLASQPVASSNFPSCLRALPQPKGPREMSSCLPLTGMGPVQVSLSIQSRVPSAPSCPHSPSASAKREDLDQKPEKQETWQPTEENPQLSVQGLKPPQGTPCLKHRESTGLTHLAWASHAAWGVQQPLTSGAAPGGSRESLPKQPGHQVAQHSKHIALGQGFLKMQRENSCLIGKSHFPGPSPSGSEPGSASPSVPPPCA